MQHKTLYTFYSHIERSNMGDVGLSLRRHFSPSHIKWYKLQLLLINMLRKKFPLITNNSIMLLTDSAESLTIGFSMLIVDRMSQFFLSPQISCTNNHSIYSGCLTKKLSLFAYDTQ